MAERITDEELKSLLSAEIRSSTLYNDSDLSDRRTKAMEYYRGEMTDTPAMANRSSVVSRDVADTMGWMLPGIIRVFTASDRMAEYDAARPGDEPFAKQATDYINHIFWKDNAGYRILWDATHDSLLQGNGIVKHYWDDSEECEYHELSGMTAEQIAMLEMDDGEIEIVAQRPGEPQKMIEQGPDGQAAEIEVPTFDVKIKRVTMNGRIVVECIEPENFLMDRSARFIEEARFCAHRSEKSRSDLIEMGFSAEVVEALPAYRGTFAEESYARQGEHNWQADVGHESTRAIEVFECYVKADSDGDGIAETIRAYYAGSPGAGELLDWEVWEDDVPFSDIPCEPVPHQWEARSVADETMDVQRIKTVLTRQMLDNLYASNLPMFEVEEGTVTNPAMLTAPKFGGIIWRKAGKATAPIQRHQVPFVADKVLASLEFFDAVVEKRTGVSRATMALDPDTLQNQTATANQNQRDAAYSQIELIARNQGELGWRRVFRQLLKTVVKHQDRPRTIRLRDEWVEMDPRAWNANMDVTINVGLGTGSRDRDMAMLNNIMSIQTGMTEQFSGAGFGDEAIDMVPRIVATATKIAESAGIKNPDTFFPQMGPDKVEQMKATAAERAQQPDPKTQIEEKKLQAEIAKGQAQLQMDQQKTQAQMQGDREKAGADIQLQREKLMIEAQLKREQMAGEMQLKREQLSAELLLKRELAVSEMHIKRDVGFYTADAKANSRTSGVHMGGEPG